MAKGSAPSKAPIVSIKVSGYDLLVALKKARQYADRVGVGIYHEKIPELEDVKELLQVEVSQQPYETIDDIQSSFSRLREQGYEVIVGSSLVVELAEDGCQAVDKARSGHFDLILMDMKMPNLDGIDATRIIRELAPDIPIIALTAYAYEHDKQAALKAGCNDFLTKPFTQEVLKETIKKWLDDKG